MSLVSKALLIGTIGHVRSCHSPHIWLLCACRSKHCSDAPHHVHSGLSRHDEHVRCAEHSGFLYCEGQPTPAQLHDAHEQKQLPAEEPYVGRPNVDGPPLVSGRDEPRGPVDEVLWPEPPDGPPTGARHQPQLPASLEAAHVPEQGGRQKEPASSGTPLWPSGSVAGGNAWARSWPARNSGHTV